MPVFTIETTFWTPAYRHCSYEAATLEDACRLAIEDDCWASQKTDYDACGPTYVTGIWHGADAAYEGQSLPVPAPFGDAEQRKIDHFDVLLALLKKHGPASHASVRDAIAKAEAILAGAPHPAM
jgi:hypothetical protein